MLKRLEKLIDVKTIITFGFVFAFIYLAFRGDIQATALENIVLMIVGFYFGTQFQKSKE
jgi:galactitol-specific phosphotransferase system IIC component